MTCRFCQAQSSSSTAGLSLALFPDYPATRPPNPTQPDPTRPAGILVFSQQTTISLRLVQDNIKTSSRMLKDYL